MVLRQSGAIPVGESAAASAAVVVAAATAAAIVLRVAATAAAREQENQDDNPAAAIVAKIETAHSVSSLKEMVVCEIFRSPVELPSHSTYYAVDKNVLQIFRYKNRAPFGE